MSKVTTDELKDLMALMIWKVRNHLDGPIIRITPADRKAMKDSLDYNEQACMVNIEVRGPDTLIHLTDTEGNQIICTENNEADLDRSQAAKNLRATRDNARQLASAIRQGLASGVSSDSMVLEACAALDTLAAA